MTNISFHDLEPGHNVQRNKAAEIFGTSITSRNIGLFAFIWQTPMAGLGANSSPTVIENVTATLTSTGKKKV
jgi:hypothetical protein